MKTQESTMINITSETGLTSMIAFMTKPAPFTIAMDGCWKTGEFLIETLTGSTHTRKLPENDIVRKLPGRV